MNKYLHTIDGCPAFFDGEMICFVRSGMWLQDILVADLDTVRKQQRASNEYRSKLGFDLHKYSYLRLKGGA